MTRTLILGLGALAVVTAVIVTFAILDNGSETASASTGGPEMVLTIKGGDCDDPVRPTSCDVATGDTFTLSVDALGIPAGGYTLMQTAIDLGTKLTYNQTAAPADEVVWPDASSAVITRAQLGNVILHGALTGLFPPLPISTYAGNLVEISLTCPAGLTSDSPAPLALLPYGDPGAGTSGAAFTEGGTGARIIPKVGSLTVTCLAPTPTPTDTPTPTITPTFTPTNTPTDIPTPTPCPPEGCPTANVKKLVSSSPIGDSGYFGISVAVSGDTAAVGSSNEDDGGNNAGIVYIFQRDQGGTGNWGEVKKLLASDSDDYYHLGWSVALDGDTLLAGAKDAELNGTRVGAVYIYERNAGGPDNWGEVKKLTASDAQYNDVFGWSVAIAGDIAVVGAFGEDAHGDWAGAAYVFDRNQGGPGNWGEVKKLLPADVAADDNFGWAVSVSGDIAVVGTRKDSDRAAYVFQRDQGGADNWGQVKKITSTADAFGTTVGVSDGVIIVGAWFDSSAGAYAGAAYLYGQNEGGPNNWGQVKQLVASDAMADANFGGSVAIDGEIAVVGSLVRPWWVDSPWPGSAYVFQRDRGGVDNWGEASKLTAIEPQPDDDFGSSVAINATVAIIGASLDDPGNSNPGAAFIFEPKLLGGPTPVPPTPTPTYDPTDTDGDGCRDQLENGTDPTKGGTRDPADPWDFYDVLGFNGAPPDRVIDLANDILSVIMHYSPTGYEPGAPALVGNGTYDDFDRGPRDPNDSWPTAPDGMIDLSNDILSIILQYGTDCR